MSTAVVVHGLWMPGAETLLLRRRLGAAGFATRQFTYHSVAQDLHANALQLAEFLGDVPGETVHLVGHSLGGVIAVRTLQSHSLERIGRVVCLGAPLQGSRSALALARLPGGQRLIGKSESAFLAGSVEPWTAREELGLICGRVPIGGGQLFGRLPAPHDGSIAVDETRLDGATEHIVLPVSHLSMLWSRAVAEQTVCFLESGRFARDQFGQLIQ